MALQKGFGQQLHDARVSSGLTYGTISRDLRIRVDILQALEEEDFSTIPPHSYARGMVHAYAHLLGLDADKVTDDYLNAALSNGDERKTRKNRYAAPLPSSLGGNVTANDIERIHQEDSRDAARERLHRRRQQRLEEQTGARNQRGGERQVSKNGERCISRSNGSKSMAGNTADPRMARNTRARNASEGVMKDAERSSNPARTIGAVGSIFASAADTVASTVGGAFARRKNIDINHSIYADAKKGGFPKSRNQQSFGAANRRQGVMSARSYGVGERDTRIKKIPFLIAVVVILALLIFAANMLFAKPTQSATNDASNAAQASSSVAISGLTDPGSAGTVEQETNVVPIAPTAAVFTYDIADGEDCYLEIYLDDANTPTVASTFTGPKRGSYDVTGTLSFVTSRPGAVTLKVDGKTVEPQDDNGDGVYVYNVDFNEILSAWKEANEQDEKDKDASSSE